MDSYDRFLSALRGEPVDRPPVACWLGLPLLLKLASRTDAPAPRTYADLYRLWIDEPLSIVEVQERFGMDPMVLTQSEHPGEVITYPRLLLPWEARAAETWRERREVIGAEADHHVVRRTVTTPEGDLSYTYRLDNHARATFEHLLKRPEDLELLRFQPDPSMLDITKIRRMTEIVGRRAVFHHVTPGVWDEACQVRGINNLSLDMFDRPEWVHRLMRHITDRQRRLIARLAEGGVQTINFNETWVGFGISPAAFREFILPYDTEVVAAIHGAGMLVSYHNCGRASRLLELHADTGADALETLTPTGRSGDVDLADAAQRVGRRITLYGGFDERVLYEGGPDDVRAEVRRCLDATRGARYILRSTGQIMDAHPGNIEAMTEAVRMWAKA
jgi:uroporphyrinogen-III decarboxylase